jgi:hypothetical protein
LSPKVYRSRRSEIILVIEGSRQLAFTRRLTLPLFEKLQHSIWEGCDEAR